MVGSQELEEVAILEVEDDEHTKQADHYHRVPDLLHQLLHRGKLGSDVHPEEYGHDHDGHKLHNASNGDGEGCWSSVLKVQTFAKSAPPQEECEGTEKSGVSPGNYS